MSDPQKTGDDYRQCEVCKLAKPAKSFPRVPGTQHNYQKKCRSCKAADRNRLKLDKIEREAIRTYLTRTVGGGSNIPHTAELLEGIMNYFGGANGFASLVMKQYFEAKPGSRMRNSLLEMVVKLASKNTEQGGARKPVSLYTDEELEAEIDGRLKLAVQAYRYIDAPQETGPAASLPIANGPDHFQLPVGGTEDLAERAGREAARSLEALQANAKADGVPPVPVQ
jgi:hypothetical protein